MDFSTKQPNTSPIARCAKCRKLPAAGSKLLSRGGCLASQYCSRYHKLYTLNSKL
jgi:hypothetical protein